MRPSVLALSILGLLLLAAGAWALWGQGTATPAPALGAAGPAAVDGTPRPALGQTDLRGADAPADPGSEAVERVVDAGARTPDGASVTLVVRFPDGTPAAGAEIRWIENGALRERGRRGDHPSEVLDGLRAFATTAVDGTAAIPAGIERLHVAASLDGSYGYRRLDTAGEWDVERGRILLVPDSSVTVTVTHPDGRAAAGVRTAVQQARDRGWRTIERAETDAGGIAHFPHLQLHQQARGREGGYRNRFRAFVDVPLRDPIAGTFQLPGHEALTLELPPTAPLTIAVHGPEGHPLAAAAEVRLTRQPDEGEEQEEGFSYEARMEAWSGKVTFPIVETGLSWRTAVRPPDRDLAWDVAPQPGPAVADVPAELVVEAPPWMASVCGALSRDGEPQVGLRADFLLAGLHGRVEGEPLTTGPEGRFELLVHTRDHHMGPYTLEVLRENAHTGAAADVPDVRAGRRIELGTLDVFDLPVFAEGVVVDDAGTPVPRAMVRRLRQQGAPPETRWMADPGVRAFTDEDGRFALFAPAGRGPWIVEAMARSHRPYRSEPLDRAASLRIVLTRTGRLVGSTPAPRWLAPRAVDLRVEPLGEGRGARVRVDVRREELVFRTGDLDPGTYRVTLRVAGFDEPLYDNANVWIGPGDQDLEPPLPDLTQRLFRYRFSAITATGAPMPPMRSPLVVRYRTLAGDERVVGFPWRGRRIEVIASSPTIEAMWMNTGCRPASGVFPAGDHELRFEVLQPVELTIEGARDLVGPDQRVRVSMVLVGETGLPEGMRARDQNSGDRRNYSRAQLSKSSGAWLPDDGGPMDVPLMLDGEYRIVLRLHGEGRGPESHVVATVPVRLDPLRKARIRVPADAEKIARGLEALQAASGR